MKNIETKILGVIADITMVPIHAISPKTTFASLQLDALDVVEIMLGVETACDVDLDDALIERMDTVQDIITYVEGVK